MSASTVHDHDHDHDSHDQATGCTCHAVGQSCGCGRYPDEHLRVPFWIVLVGVGAGAFWALTGVAVGHALARRRALTP